jgi:hypothetical protein
MERTLVAASPVGLQRLRGMLGAQGADLASSYASGVEALLRNQYARVVVDLLFAESRMVKFARLVKEEQPSAEVVCVNATGYPLHPTARSEIDARLRRLGSGELVDLARPWEGRERRVLARDRRAAPRGAIERRRHSESYA